MYATRGRWISAMEVQSFTEAWFNGKKKLPNNQVIILTVVQMKLSL